MSPESASVAAYVPTAWTFSATEAAAVDVSPSLSVSLNSGSLSSTSVIVTTTSAVTSAPVPSEIETVSV